MGLIGRYIRRTAKDIRMYLQLIRQTGRWAMPPVYLRTRVNAGKDGFLSIGRHCAQDIRDTLKKNGMSLDSFKRVLDFGCGCGRTLLWLAPRNSPSPFFATDVDAQAVQWCRHALKTVTCDTNGALPPLRYPDGWFDLVYAVSVFSHLPEEFQHRWLRELARVLRTGGVALLSVHGRWCADNVLSPEERGRLTDAGFLFLTTEKWHGIFPDWYGGAYHTEQYIRTEWGKYLTVRDYIPRGMNQHQDLVVLTKAGNERKRP